MSKSVMIIDTPRDCCECPFGTIVFGKDVCLLCEGNGIDCPLKPYKDSIPIEWIEKRIEKLESEPLFFITDYEPVILEDLIADWRKENEQI